MSNDIEVYESQPTQVMQTSSAFSGNIQSFEDAQRVAKALSTSTLVPRDYQGNVANTMIALEMAQRVGASPMAVMQNLHIIQGRPSWSSQFVIAALNGCGRFSPLRFELTGQGDNMKCFAWCIDKSDGEKLVGPTVSMEMAKAEGWLTKGGSKWKTMPELMIRYRSAKFFGNLFAPDIMMGMHTDDEVQDFSRQQQRSGPVKIKQAFQPAQEPPKQKEPEIIEAETSQPNEINDF